MTFVIFALFILATSITRKIGADAIKDIYKLAPKSNETAWLITLAVVAVFFALAVLNSR